MLTVLIASSADDYGCCKIHAVIVDSC